MSSMIPPQCRLRVSHRRLHHMTGGRLLLLRLLPKVHLDPLLHRGDLASLLIF